MQGASRIVFFFNDTATTEIYTLSLHDALPISRNHALRHRARIRLWSRRGAARRGARSEEHTSELQSQSNLVCRLLLEKKKTPRSPPSPRSTRPPLLLAPASPTLTPSRTLFSRC